MKVLITTTYTPFVKGGAELHADALKRALINAGHQADIWSFPFNYSSTAGVIRSLVACETEDYRLIDAADVEKIICLKFPTYCNSDDRRVVWLLHQHRPAYELFDATRASAFEKWARDRIIDADRRYLTAAHGTIFTNSKLVSSRLTASVGIRSTPLYHPPPAASEISPGELGDYIFFPSRFETLKRHALLVDAVKKAKRPVKVVMTGDGGERSTIEKRIVQEGLHDRISVLGHVSAERLRQLYAGCRAVCFPPKDEDYGYVTLEAMLAGKAVITCADSGGPLEFISHGRNGLVADPSPAALAECLELVTSDPVKSRALGQQGLSDVRALNLTWEAVIESLLGGS